MPSFHNFQVLSNRNLILLVGGCVTLNCCFPLFSSAVDSPVMKTNKLWQQKKERKLHKFTFFIDYNNAVIDKSAISKSFAKFLSLIVTYNGSLDISWKTQTIFLVLILLISSTLWVTGQQWNVSKVNFLISCFNRRYFCRKQLK